MFGYCLILSFILFDSTKSEVLRLNEESTEDIIKFNIDTATLQNSPWEPIRIVTEYLGDPTEMHTKFLNPIIETSQMFLMKHFMVRRTNNTIKYGSSNPSSINNIQIPHKYIIKEYEADLVFFVQIVNQNTNYLAAASPIVGCQYSQRPIFSMILWNIQTVNFTEKVSNAVFESYVETTIHEMIHGLGFTSSYFYYYYDSHTSKVYPNQGFYFEQQSNGSSQAYISTPRLLAHAQRHFGCPSLTKIIMENNGTSATKNSHFERTLLYNEIMTGSKMTGDFVFSEFTFLFLQDTGFYQLSNFTADYLSWGKSKGCSFVEQYCKGGKFNEFCSSIYSESCSFAHDGVGLCTNSDPLLDNDCSYTNIYSDFDCRDKSTNYSTTKDFLMEYGYNSMCFEGSASKQINKIQSSSCYKYECTKDKKIQVIIDGLKYDCSQNSTFSKGYYGEIECPSNKICEQQNECEDQCSSRGFCVGGKCTCIFGYSGSHCQDYCQYYRYGDECVQQCPEQTFPVDSTKFCLGCPAYCDECSNYNQCTKCQEHYTLVNGFCDNFNSQPLSESYLTSQNQVFISNKLTNTVSQIILAISLVLIYLF